MGSKQALNRSVHCGEASLASDQSNGLLWGQLGKDGTNRLL